MAYNCVYHLKVGEQVGEDRVLIYKCPHCVVRYNSEPECMLSIDENTYNNSYCVNSDIVRKCPIESDGVCYKLQTIEAYNRDHHKFILNGKEVRVMDLKAVKEARRMEDGNCVAVDDIVAVESGYISRDIYEELGRKNNFTARICSFESDCIIFDYSKQYYSKQIVIPYTAIKQMKVVCWEERKNADCD